MLLDADKLLTEQIHSAFSSYPSIAIANLLSGILVYAALHALDDVNPVYLNGWLLSQTAISITWVWLYRRYHNNYIAIRATWEKRIEIPTGLWAGLNWGMLWVLFINPDNLQGAFFLNAAICGVVIGIVVGNPLNPKIMLFTLLPCLLPIIAKALWLGGPLFNWIALVASLLMLASVAFNRVLQTLYLKMLYQREENARLAAELAQEKAQVEKISAEKTRFLAAASHDLRQPIQAMHLFEGALAATLTTQEQHALLARISEAGKNLSQLLEKLLDISRLDADSVRPEPTLVYLDDLFYRLQQHYAGLAAECGVNLRVAPTSQQACIDPTQLERASWGICSAMPSSTWAALAKSCWAYAAGRGAHFSACGITARAFPSMNRTRFLTSFIR